MSDPHFKIVGVINTTPDSYHDGGLFNSIDQAIRRVGEMLEEGADIIEIGGESTGPGSQDVAIEEELDRTIPIIEAIRKQYPEANVSIDTYKSQIAKEAIGRGVMMVNDVTAGRSDPAMLKVIAESDVDLVLMFAKDPTPRTTIETVEYDDVIETIREFLIERKQQAIDAGVGEGHIVLDPGLGHFVSDDSQYSFQIIRELHKLTDLGPIFLSPSRKSFLAGTENLPTSERLPGTIVASASAVQNGATYIRTHDVGVVRRGCNIALCINQ